MNTIPSLPDIVRAALPRLGSAEVSYDPSRAPALSIAASCPSAHRRCGGSARRAVRHWVDALAGLGIVVESLNTSIPSNASSGESGKDADIGTLRRHLAEIGELGATSLQVALVVRPGESGRTVVSIGCPTP